MAKTYSATSVLSPQTLVPVGSLLACVAALFGLARHVATIEIQTESNAKSNAEIRVEQKATASDLSKEMSEIRMMQAATNAKLTLLIDYFGIQQPRQRR